MGKVLNRFEMLKQYRESDLKNSQEERYAFALTCVLVQDVKDKALDVVIQQNLGTWANILWRQLLLISNIAVNEPSQVGAITCEYYNFYKLYMVTDSSLKKEREKIVNPLMRRLFGLPESGSYLLLTDDIYSDNITRIPIDSERIVDCIENLRDYCRLDHHEHSDYESLVTVLGKGEEDIRQQTGRPIIDLLLDTVSLVFKEDDFGNEVQTGHVKGLLKRLRKEAEGKEDAEQRIFEISEYIATLYDQGYNLFSNRKTESLIKYINDDNQSKYYCKEFRDEDFSYKGFITSFEVNESIPIFKIDEVHASTRKLIEKTVPNYDLLDRLSKKFYDSYNKLQKAFETSIVENALEGDVDVEDYEEFDYSGLTIYLGKIVENEFYKSVGQMLRRIIGIEMPRYFAKYCEEFGGMSVLAGKKWVNLNSEKLGIPMGDLLCAYDVFVDKEGRRCISKSYKTDFEYFKGISSKLHKFIEDFAKYYRNLPAHIDLESKKTYEGAKIQFTLFTSLYLKELYAIRQGVISGTYPG